MDPLSVVLEDVVHRYPGKGRDTPGPVSARIDPGTKWLLSGAVGSGKSTLLLRIAGIRQGAGRVLIDGQTSPFPPALRRRIGFLWQNPDDGLFLPTVLEDVSLGPINDGVEAPVARHRAHDWLEQLGLASLAAHEVERLSGGEKQLVALAGLFVREPGLLLLDEPFSALDSAARRRVIEILSGHPATVILASHEAKPAFGGLIHGQISL